MISVLLAMSLLAAVPAGVDGYPFGMECEDNPDLCLNKCVLKFVS